MDMSYPILLILALASAFGLGIWAHVIWSKSRSRKPGANEPLPVCDKSQAGSVFTVLMVGLGMAATLSVATYQILAGPVASVARVTQHNLAKNQMITINRIALMDAVLQPSNGDCDTDGYIEPRPWRSTTGQKPANGGLIPLSMGAPTSDPWMSDYGYCVWDVGTLSAQAGCGGATGRLDGADNPVSGDARTLTVMAVISSGPDRVFQTTCNAYVDATTDLISIAGSSDDLIQRYTYAEAAAGGGGEGLWFLKSGDPTTATIDRGIEIGGSGLVQATAVTTTGRMIAGDGLRVADQTAVLDAECTAFTKGLIRYNDTTSSLEFCIGTAWTALGGGGGGGSLDALSDATANATSINIALGEFSLAAITTGKYNSAVGQNALQAVTTGEGNIAIGAGDPAAGGPLYAGALGRLTTGSQNTAIGPSALSSLTTAGGNLAIGYAAGAGLTTGAANVAIGNGSMIYAGNLSEYNTAVGHQALQGNFANLTAGYNTAVGGNALRRASSANSNVMVGFNAGENLTTGSQNTAVGMWALGSQTDVAGSTALGYGSLYSNTTGTINTGLGTNTLTANTSGRGNVAVGGGGPSVADGAALRANTTGNYNIALGVEALTSNTSGGENIAIGVGALRSNTTGIRNTAVGHNALKANTTGYATAVGDLALAANTTGVRNTAVGGGALSANTAAFDNTAVGSGALQFTTTGGANTAVGSAALRWNATGTDNTAVGTNALFLSGGSTNTAVGSDALRNHTTGSNNTAVGDTALNNNTTGSNNTAVGASSGPSSAALTNSTALGYNASVTASNSVRIGNTAVTTITGQVDFTFPSDRRDKHDIENSDLGLDFIRSLRPVRYRLNGGTERLDYGFIAQEVEQALAGRETNMITRQNDERGSYLFRSSDMLGPIVRSVQETNARIDALGAISPAAPLPLWLQILFAGAALSVVFASCYVVFTYPRTGRRYD